MHVTEDSLKYKRQLALSTPQQQVKFQSFPNSLIESGNRLGTSRNPSHDELDCHSIAANLTRKMGLGINLNSRVTHINEKSCAPKQSIHLDPNEEIKLNVGGTLFTTKVLDLLRIPGTFLERMVDKIWKSPNSEIVFIDRDPKYFGVLLEFLTTGKVNLPRSEVELAAIVQEAEMDELIAKIIQEDRRCFGKGPPFFPKDRVVWKTRNFWRSLAQHGWNFDGTRKAIPLCFTYFTLFSPNEVCYMCGVETQNLHGLYKSLFDFPRDFSYTTGEIEKIYGDCCCCDVRFGKSSFIFHIPTKMLRLVD